MLLVYRRQAPPPPPVTSSKNRLFKKWSQLFDNALLFVNIDACILYCPATTNGSLNQEAEKANRSKFLSKSFLLKTAKSSCFRSSLTFLWRNESTCL